MVNDRWLGSFACSTFVADVTASLKCRFINSAKDHEWPLRSLSDAPELLSNSAAAPYIINLLQPDVKCSEASHFFSVCLLKTPRTVRKFPHHFYANENTKTFSARWFY